jgi:hypothetical protein
MGVDTVVIVLKTAGHTNIELAVNISRFRLLKNTHWLRTFEIVNRHSSLLAKPCITIANMKSISIY